MWLGYNHIKTKESQKWWWKELNKQNHPEVNLYGWLWGVGGVKILLKTNKKRVRTDGERIKQKNNFATTHIVVPHLTEGQS